MNVFKSQCINLLECNVTLQFKQIYLIRRNDWTGSFIHTRTHWCIYVPYSLWINRLFCFIKNSPFLLNTASIKSIYQSIYLSIAICSYLSIYLIRNVDLIKKNIFIECCFNLSIYLSQFVLFYLSIYLSYKKCRSDKKRTYLLKVPVV